MEIMVTVFVAAILLAAAVPSFRSTLQNNRVADQANRLVMAMNLARGQAVSSGAPVSVCASSNQTACNASQSNWATGWIVFTDRGTPGQVDTTGTNPDKILRVWPAPKGNPSIQETSGSYVQYLPSGQAVAGATYKLTIPGCTGKQQRTITVSAVGLVTVAAGSCP